MSEAERVQLGHAISAVPLTQVRQAGGSAADVDLQGPAALRQAVELRSQRSQVDPVHHVHPSRIGRGRRRVEHFLQRSEEHTSELQSRQYLVCRLLLEKKNT